MQTLNLADLETMTMTDGEGWALPHARRILRLAEVIGADLNYDLHAFKVAAYLHDWGAFPRYWLPGIEHALRSRQIAEAEILPRMDLSAGQITLILDAIALHDYRDKRPALSTEALLLREADFLDLLGAIGFAREFAYGPNNLEVCYQRILKHQDVLCGKFRLPIAQNLAAKRFARFGQCLTWLEEESYGYL